MYYVSVETFAWVDRDVIEGASHEEAATSALARAFPRHDIPVGCVVRSHDVMNSTYINWKYDGKILINQTKG